MKCTTVRTKLAGYLDDAIAKGARPQDRVDIREHLDLCAACRTELQRYRKLSILLSRTPRFVPPPDLAVRIRIAAARVKASESFTNRLRRMSDHAQVVLDNVFRPLTVPATGGFFSAILVFAMVLQLMAPGLSVQAVANDVPLDILRPAELITLSEYPQSWAPEQHDVELALPHGLLVDVTVDAHGTMVGYQILAGPSSVALRHQLDQMLLFSRFRPMLSFGRPTTGGHVILSFSAVHVRG
jgi:hypothetical protein